MFAVTVPKSSALAPLSVTAAVGAYTTAWVALAVLRVIPVVAVPLQVDSVELDRIWSFSAESVVLVTFPPLKSALLVARAIRITTAPFTLRVPLPESVTG
jgi:hypothetical protein